MSYGYLIEPTKQFLDINGKPLVGGHVEVYLHTAHTQYITYSDFNGTENQFKIPLNVKGMTETNVIAEDTNAYDVFVYDEFGAPFASAENVSIGASSPSYSSELPIKIEGSKITNNGVGLTCTGANAWAEGDHTSAIGDHSHSEGYSTISSGANSHAEGCETESQGEHSHAEGFRTIAGTYGHAEGAGTESSNIASHAEGQDTEASGTASHAEGRGSEASGNYSHASGYGTRATGEGSTAVGKFNDDGDSLFVVGNGSDTFHRKDVFKVDRNEDTWVMIGGVLTKLTIDAIVSAINARGNNLV